MHTAPGFSMVIRQLVKVIASSLNEHVIRDIMLSEIDKIPFVVGLT